MTRAAKEVKPSFGPAISRVLNQSKVQWATSLITAMLNANLNSGSPIIFAAILNNGLAGKIGLDTLRFKAFLNHSPGFFLFSRRSVSHAHRGTRKDHGFMTEGLFIVLRAYARNFFRSFSVTVIAIQIPQLERVSSSFFFNFGLSGFGLKLGHHIIFALANQRKVVVLLNVTSP